MTVSRTCVFCHEPASGQGEHVLPRWLLKRWKGQGPFTIWAGGEPLKARGGAVARYQNIERVLLPVCGDGSRNNCNGWLNLTFEGEAQRPMEALLNDLAAIGEPDVTAVARWAVKTLLLYRHPLARHMEREKVRQWRDEYADRHEQSALSLPPDLLPQMRQTGRLPADVSLWVAVVDEDTKPLAPPAIDLFSMPSRVHREDGAGGRPGSSTLGFGPLGSNGAGTRMVFHLLFHPLIDVRHPLEEQGLVSRLWPRPPTALDPQLLPRLDAAAGRYVGGWFQPSGMSVGLQDGERWPQAGELEVEKLEFPPGPSPLSPPVQ